MYVPSRPGMGRSSFLSAAVITSCSYFPTVHVSTTSHALSESPASRRTMYPFATDGSGHSARSRSRMSVFFRAMYWVIVSEGCRRPSFLNSAFSISLGSLLSKYSA